MCEGVMVYGRVDSEGVMVRVRYYVSCMRV